MASHAGPDTPEPTWIGEGWSKAPTEPTTDDEFDGSYHEELPPEFFDNDAGQTDDAPPLEAYEAPKVKGAETPADDTSDETAAGAISADTAFRDVVAALHNKPLAEVRRAVTRLRSESLLWDSIEPDTAELFNKLLDVLEFEETIGEADSLIDFNHLSGLVGYGKDVRREAVALLQRRDNGQLPPYPLRQFEAVMENLTADRAAAAAKDFARTIEVRAPVADRLDAYSRITSPTRRTASAEKDKSYMGTGEDWEERYELERTSGGSAGMRFSSGLRSLDAALTGDGEPLGFIAPGEFMLIPAGTGHGKSAFVRQMLKAILLDIVEGWGQTDARWLHAFTEENSYVILKAAEMLKGQAFERLKKNIVLVDANASGPALAMSFYDTIEWAEAQSLATGRPITEFMLRGASYDYIQGFEWPGCKDKTENTIRTADFLMRGVAPCNPEAMAHFSGISYQEHTGRDWPEGLEFHKVAVVVMSQLTKLPAASEYVDGSSDPAGFMRYGGNEQPLWTLKDGDFMIPGMNYIAGSQVLQNHATVIMWLHRSRPKGDNAVVADPFHPTGRGLSDKRARFVVVKARNGIRMEGGVIPVRFDSNHEGYRGQYYDDAAHQALVVNGCTTNPDGSPDYVTELYIDPESGTPRQGSPILPVRSRPQWPTIHY